MIGLAFACLALQALGDGWPKVDDATFGMIEVEWTRHQPTRSLPLGAVYVTGTHRATAMQADR